MMWPPRMHLARCDYCNRKIAWSRRRRQWLALAPFTSMRGTQLARRMVCPLSPNLSYHDPKVTAFERAMAQLGGAP